MKSILYVMVIKKTQLSCSKLRIIWKIKLSVSLINGESLSLSLSRCCQCRFKRYIAKQTNSKTEETVPLQQLVCFLFLSLSMWQAINHMVSLFFFTLINFSFKDYNKKTSEISPSILSFFFKILCIQTCRCTHRML